MKAVSKFVVLFSLGLFATLAANAASYEQTYIETCRKAPQIPLPVSVVSPSVGLEYSGLSVDVQFIVEPNGTTADVSVKSPVDEALASAVVDAVKQWKFKPVTRGGVPVATKVVLPMKIVDPTSAGSVYAAN